jgi:hypothetical protein
VLVACEIRARSTGQLRAQHLLRQPRMPLALQCEGRARQTLMRTAAASLWVFAILSSSDVRS